MDNAKNTKNSRPLAPKYRVRRTFGASNPKRFGVTAKGKRVYIRTFGCQMNDRDSEALLGLFLQEGYIQAKSEKDADVVLVNTCSVRAHAENRALSFVGKFRKKGTVPVRGQSPIIGVIGCMAQNLGQDIFRKMQHVDLICGPSSFNKIPGYIDKIRKERVRVVDLEDTAREEDFYNASFRAQGDRAQIVISTGCSNYCTYCVVPFVRGGLRLRNPEDIISEVKRNLSLGIKKITLLGQNVNDYKILRIKDKGKRIKERGKEGEETIDFVGLLKKIEKIDEIEEVDFLTSQPKNTSKELFTLMAKSSKINKHLHLPFQSGSNKILKAMNRGYTREKYLQLVDDYKKIVKGTLSTDVIVGFSGENESDFEQTKDILEKVRFRGAYIFKYSPRPRAKSSGLADDVSKQDKERRHAILLELQKNISREF